MKGLFIITGPSGVGKSSLTGALVNKLSDIRVAISHTTRSPRGDEKHGVHYYFIDKETFNKMIEEKKLAEWTQIHGHYYGTSHEEIQTVERDESDLFLEIEGHGALQIKGQYPMALTIFVLPPSLRDLRQRLEERGTDSQEEIDRRMKNALAEIEYIEQFEFIVINDVLKQAADQLEYIVQAHRLRRKAVWPSIADRFKG